MSSAVAEARRWIGTPYRAGASVRGAGADCLGLLLGVWRALYGAAPDAADRAGREPLWRGLAACCDEGPAGDLRHGRVALLRLREAGPAGHVGLLTADGLRPGLIHAYCRRGVVESPLCQPWRRRVVATFALPETP